MKRVMAGMAMIAVLFVSADAADRRISIDSLWVSSANHLRATISNLHAGDQIRCAAEDADGVTLAVTRWRRVDPPVHEMLIRVHDMDRVEGIRCWLRTTDR